jgi:lactoylglutathione lyase
MGQPQQPIISRAFPVVYAADVERAARFWELLGFRRHVQLPPDGEPGYVGLRSHDPGPELAITNAQWATDRYGLSMGDGPRFEMYVYVADLDGMLRQLAAAAARAPPALHCVPHEPAVRITA